MSVRRRAFLAVLMAFSAVVASAAIKDSDERDQDHGVIQMHRFLHSRPFASYFRSTGGNLENVKETDAIFVWAADRFDGKDTREPMIWIDDLPDAMDDALADAVGKDKNAPAYIRISPVYRSGARKGHYRDFESLWWSLVFELNNVVTPIKVDALIARIEDGSITRDQFIDRCARLEYDSVQKTQQFYREVWLPWAEERGFKSESRVWTSRFADSFEEWMKQFENSEYPRGYYGKMFDENRR